MSRKLRNQSTVVRKGEKRKSPRNHSKVNVAPIIGAIAILFILVPYAANITRSVTSHLKPPSSSYNSDQVVKRSSERDYFIRRKQSLH